MTLKTPNAPMTVKQGLAIRFNLGYDMRPCNLTMQQASDILSGLKNPSEFAGAILKGETKQEKPKQDFAAVYAEAHAAGMAAGNGANVIPMQVQQHANMLDDSSPVVKRYDVPDGVCGFAWISFKGNTAFGRWMKSKDLAHAGTYGGLSVWVGQFNQSMQRKEAYAHAFATVLGKHGIEAYPQSRMD
jgi:hypothetical protein